LQFLGQGPRIKCAFVSCDIITFMKFSVFGVIFSFFLLANNVFAYDFNQNLRIGVRGQDVFELQNMLNQDARTRVSEQGPGSPGRETSYFGPATLQAVIKFQEIYSDEVLKPLNLKFGTGFVGALTRKKLSAISSEITQDSPVYETESIVEKSNPNLVNLDILISKVEEVSQQSGYNQEEIQKIIKAIKQIAESERNFRQEFEEVIFKQKFSDNLEEKSLLGKIFARTLVFFKINPPKAYAQVVSRPFGGKLLSPLPCADGSWMLALSPLPPDMAALLSYRSGSQAYANYNIPATIYLLGLYTPVGVCPLPPPAPPVITQGTISPTVGSSAF